MVKVTFIAFASFFLTASSALASGGHGAPVTGNTMTAIQIAAFVFLLIVLGKFAWAPILRGLNDREDDIRASLDNAEKAKKDLAELQATSAKMKADADAEAKTIITAARDTATKLAKDIEEKANGEAKAKVENALKDIEAARTAALESLKKESAELAISLAGKVLGENLDTEKNRALTQNLIEKL